MAFYYTLRCEKLQISDIGHLQTHNFGAVLENIFKLFSEFLLLLVQSGFKLQFSVILTSVALL